MTEEKDAQKGPAPRSLREQALATERKLYETEARSRSLEENLRISEQRFRAMFEQAGVGIAFADRAGQLQEVNKRYCQIVGYSREELLSGTYQSITHVDDRAQNHELLERLWNGEPQVEPMEKRYVRKDGTLVWASLSLSLLHNASGEPVQSMAVIEDITERKHAEGALRDAKVRMEEFLGIASHELRTPLTTIKANIQLALRRLKTVLQSEDREPQEQGTKLVAAYDMLERAERQVGVINRLVGDMIDISRIQSGKLQVHLRQQPCNLIAIVQEVIQEQGKATPGRHITFAVPPQQEILVFADADRVGQVLDNYLSNALKYSASDKQVDVAVTLADDQVCVAVRDEGQGISARELQQIWECFYQAEGVKVISGSGVGLGLGLHISKTIIERHHGQVGVESAPEKGSTFWFTLPLACNNSPSDSH